MKNIFAIAAFVCLAITVQSCNKDKDSDPTPTPAAKVCRLTSATVIPPSGEGITYSFSYNNDHKISQIISSDSPVNTTTFTYSGNTINVAGKSGTTQTDKTIITTNAAGLQLHSETRDLDNDTVISSIDYEYGSNGDLLKITNIYGDDDPTITNASSSDGNIISLNGSGSLTTMEYYTDQKFRIGDYFHILQMIQTGTAFYIVNKNLVKSFSSGSNITNFNYTFDADNNITQLDIISGADITTVHFQQVCE